MSDSSVVWVLGGTSGIGKACADLIEEADEEYDVVRTNRHDCDVADVEKLRAKFRYLRSYGNTVDYVLFAAGLNGLGWLEQMGRDNRSARFKLALQRRIFEVNVVGFINLMAVLAAEADHPISVVAISSDAAERPLRTSIGYCASKAALNQAVRVAARELGPDGWRVNAVSPGMTAGTEMTTMIDAVVPKIRGWTPEQAKQYEASQEVVPGRVQPSEIAEVVLGVLFGPAHMNGSIITLNGGR